MAQLPFEPLWLGRWTPGWARALQAPRMLQPRARGEGHSLQRNRAMGTRAGKDRETQVGGCLCLRAPLPPSLVAGISGEEHAAGDMRTLCWGHSLLGWLREEQSGKPL